MNGFLRTKNIEKIKIVDPYLIYQLIRLKSSEVGQDWLRWLAVKSKTAPKILTF